MAWEELYDWPPDPMWTESNWPSGQPTLQLFQVIFVFASLHVTDSLCFVNLRVCHAIGVGYLFAPRLLPSS